MSSIHSHQHHLHLLLLLPRIVLLLFTTRTVLGIPEQNGHRVAEFRGREGREEQDAINVCLLSVPSQRPTETTTARQIRGNRGWRRTSPAKRQGEAGNPPQASHGASLPISFVFVQLATCLFTRRLIHRNANNNNKNNRDSPSATSTEAHRGSSASSKIKSRVGNSNVVALLLLLLPPMSSAAEEGIAGLRKKSNSINKSSWPEFAIHQHPVLSKRIDHGIFEMFLFGNSSSPENHLPGE